MLEENYEKIVSPVRVQYTHYRNGLSDAFPDGYSRAKGHLQKVFQLLPFTEAGETPDKTEKMGLELK